MPSKSKAQRNFMAAAAHNPEFAKKAGIPVSVAKEFNAADKGKKFKSGGNVANLKKLFKGKDTKAEELKEAKAIKSGKITPEQYAKGEEMEKGMKKGGCCKMAKGGKVKETMGPKTMSQDVEKGSNKLTKFGESAVQKRGKTKGKNLGDSGKSVGIQGGKAKKYAAGGISDEGNDIIRPEDMKPKTKKMAKGGVTRADGCAQRGKTKGKFV